MYFLLFNWAILMVVIFIQVAFSTLLERKLLSYSQQRVGPNKTFFKGILQPFSDAIKLLSKENLNQMFNNLMTFMNPLLAISILLLYLLNLSSNNVMLKSMWYLIFFLTVMALSIYPILLMGWGSNNMYANLGGLRNISQTVAYEVVLMLTLFFFCYQLKAMDFNSPEKLNHLRHLEVLTYMGFFVLFLFACVVETNRAPFDFAESESELVSGFNIEYSASMFTLIFLAEYGIILFFSELVSTVFLGTSLMNFQVFFLSSSLTFLWFILRCTYVRFRYDYLMMFCWKSIIPILIIMLLTVPLNM